MRALAGLMVALFLLSGCAGHVSLPSYGVVEPFDLTDSSGKPFDSRTLDGHVWIADFIFTNCAGPCPRMSSQMRLLQIRLDGDASAVKLVSFTVDPDRDTPEVLAEYSRRYHAESGRWYFLTGPKPRLHHITREVFRLGDVTGTLEHSTRFALVDKQGRIRGFYPSDDTAQIQQLFRDAKVLLPG
ncbi:MAG: SCO family protein [Bryobacteraceae bacterium]